MFFFPQDTGHLIHSSSFVLLFIPLLLDLVLVLLSALYEVTHTNETVSFKWADVISGTNKVLSKIVNKYSTASAKEDCFYKCFIMV